MSFLAELRRRNVIRMAGLYAVGAWLIVQVAETVLPIFHTPDWVLQALVVLLALGFLPALVFSWIFELTPEGIRREADVETARIEAPQTAQRMDRLLLICMVLVIGLIAADRFWPRNAMHAEINSVQLSNAGVEGNTRPAAAASVVDTRSIAVLPFVNMSPDADNEYFADGISEELLNILAGIGGLKVSSRTSAFSFKGKDTPIPEIARQLGVHHVLEGSVRKQGNQVRVTAQLIEAGSDAHLWTQTYQRDLDDIFQVQEEIATAITTALKGILGAQQVRVDVPTKDMTAYQRYLHGRSRFYQRFELDQAIDDLRFAVERDPEFAEAWAFLAAAYWLVGNTGYATAHERSAMAELAGPAVDRAMALKPDMPITLALKGRLIVDSDAPGHVAEGIRLMERAAALPAADTTPKLWLSLVWLELGRVDRALPLLESAQRLDPLVGINSGALGVAHAMEGRRDAGVSLVLRAVELDGLSVWGNILAVDRIYDDDRAGAAQIVAAMMPRFSERFASDRAGAEGLLAALRDPAREQAYLQLAEEDLADTFSMSASLMFEHGSRAFEFIANGRAKSWVVINSAWLPAMRWLREDPRYFQMMEASGRVEYWDSQGYPRGCEPVDSPGGRRLSCPERP
jgi:TolB-like protein/Flp pilus assembly protein TadD